MSDKLRPSVQKREEYYYSQQYYRGRPYGSESRNFFRYNTGEEYISSPSSPKLHGHWPWRECVHRKTSVCQPITAKAGYKASEGSWYVGRVARGANYITESAPALPTKGWDESVMEGIISQIDLNTSDSVLLYSGVLQAVPLLGGALKFTSILNRAARNLSKSFRKKPFTTVVKSLISADFIDRFVISPTIDDARKFADATNYVLRVIETARDRNEHAFALKTQSTDWIQNTESTGHQSSGNVSNDVIYRTQRFVESKAFALLEARYDMTAVDPIKIWAQRVGLTRPLDSVWDLVPFSFVLDYFTRAGDFISALSDEMSSVEGLKGSITKIHDLWGSCFRCGRTTAKGINVQPDYGYIYDGQTVSDVYAEGLEAVIENSEYRRFRVDNPWMYLLSLSEKLGDYLTINTELSATRKRTIAELVIQILF